MREEPGEGGITRRSLLFAAPAFMMAPWQALAQAGAAPITTHMLNNVMIAVSDMTQSVSFYQKLFGPPIQQGDVAIFPVGKDHGFFGLTKVKDGAQPGFLSYGITVENFDPDALVKILTDHGAQGVQATTRDGTPEVWASDPNGIRFQLQHTGYNHGSGPNGDILPHVPAATVKPAFQLKTISHVTLLGVDGPRTYDFYQKLFNLRVLAKQGTSVWTFALGPGLDAIVYPVTGHNERAKGSINHVCYTIEHFDPSRVMGILENNGLEPIEYGGNPASVKPMTCRIRLRQRANGGGGPTSPMGTAELYLNDPDNISLQLQDVSYCGGSGWLGQVCS